MKSGLIWCMHSLNIRRRLEMLGLTTINSKLKNLLFIEQPPPLFGGGGGAVLFVRFAAGAFRGLPSIYVFSYFPFGFEGRMWDLIVSVPDHCLSFYIK